jgi:hypothetical protein
MSSHLVYNTDNYPHFVCNNGNWDIYTDAKGYCASIPTPEAAAQGCKATHFGDRGYVRAVLGVDPLDHVPC